MAVLPIAPTLLGAVCAVVAPETLSSGTVHLYVPCALLALFCNIILDGCSWCAVRCGM